MMNPLYIAVPGVLGLIVLYKSRRRVPTQKMIKAQYPGGGGDIDEQQADSEMDEFIASGEYDTGTSDYGAMFDLEGSSRSNFNTDLESVGRGGAEPINYARDSRGTLIDTGGKGYGDPTPSPYGAPRSK